VDVQVAYAVTAHMCMWLTTIRVATLLRGDMWLWAHSHTWAHTSCKPTSRVHAAATWARVTLAIVGKH